MIKPIELRIGNLVEEPKGSTHKIEQIYEAEKRQRYGIVITGKHLLSFGFKEGKWGYWYDTGTHVLDIYPKDGEYLYPVFVEYQETSNEFLGSVSLPRLRYVHELQNLFFALTGRELEMPEK